MKSPTPYGYGFPLQSNGTACALLMIDTLFFWENRSSLTCSWFTTIYWSFTNFWELEDWNDIANAVVLAEDPSSPFTVESDASDHTIAVTRIQNRCIVAFFFCTLSWRGCWHYSVEKKIILLWKSWGSGNTILSYLILSISSLLSVSIV